MATQRALALALVAALTVTGCLTAASIPSEVAVDLPSSTATPTGTPRAATAAPPTAPPPTTAPTATLPPTTPPSPTPSPSPTAVPSPTATATASAEITPAPIGLAPTGPVQEARVVSVTDGDTIRVQMAGQEYRVRYIGIDTPETVHPSQPVEWMGREASDANRALVEGRVVVLETDVSETDHYGRLLRYVWLAEGTGWLLVNLALVRHGFAQASTYPPDVKYTEMFLAGQRSARDDGLGLWGVPPEVAPEPDHDDDDDSNGNGGSGGNCDAAYPGVCIPPYPPDLNCGDISERRFKVLPPDPHGFDGDGDGIGCESG